MRTHIWFQSKLHLLHFKVRAISFMNIILSSLQSSLLPDLSSPLLILQVPEFLVCAFGYDISSVCLFFMFTMLEVEPRIHVQARRVSYYWARTALASLRFLPGAAEYRSLGNACFLSIPAPPL